VLHIVHQAAFHACLPVSCGRLLHPSGLEVATSLCVVLSSPSLHRPVLRPSRTRRISLHQYLISTQLQLPAHKTPPSAFHCFKYSLPSIAVPDSVCSQFSATFSMRLATKGVNYTNKKNVSNSLPLNCPQKSFLGVFFCICLTLNPAKSGHTYVRTFL